MPEVFIYIKQQIPQNTKLLLYKVVIRSIITYGFPIWFTISPIVVNELEVFERKILRKCVNKHSNIYNRTGIVPLCKYAQNLQSKIVEKLEHQKNHLMNENYHSENSISLRDTSYLSPVGIANEFVHLQSTEITSWK